MTTEPVDPNNLTVTADSHPLLFNALIELDHCLGRVWGDVEVRTRIQVPEPWASTVAKAEAELAAAQLSDDELIVLVGGEVEEMWALIAAKGLSTVDALLNASFEHWPGCTP